jgi:hypothetical protein
VVQDWTRGWQRRQTKETDSRHNPRVEVLMVLGDRFNTEDQGKGSQSLGFGLCNRIELLRC